MAVLPILAALGGAVGIATLAQTFASIAFRLAELLDEIKNPGTIRTWDKIKEIAENEATTVDEDKAEIQKWIAEHS